MRRATGILLALGIFACSDPSPVGLPSTSFDMNNTSPVDGVSSARQSTENLPFPRILCFGDSLTFGVTSRTAEGLAALATVEGYVPKLERLLIQQYGEGVEIINSGIGGETSSEGLERLGSEIRLFQPDLVLLLHGIVDVNSEQPRFPRARDNLADMMRVVLRHDIAIIIGTYPLLNPEGFRIRGIDNIPRLNDVIRQEAKLQNVPIADHEIDWGGDLSMQGPDGLHPNNNGYDRMAETWLRAIQDLAARQST